MDKNNSSLEDTTSSGVFTWINSDLYNLQEGAVLQIDKNSISVDKNCASDGSNQVHTNDYQGVQLTRKSSDVKFKQSFHFFDPNMVKNRLFPKSTGIFPVSKGDEKQIFKTVDNAGGASVSSQIPKSSSSTHQDICFKVNLYIETKLSHIGPLQFEVHPKTSIRLLKLQVENELGIPSASQQWILKNTLGNDNDKSLSDYGVTPMCPVFLYVDSSFERKIDIQLLSGTTPDRYPTISGNKFKPVHFSSFFDATQSAAESMHRRKDKNAEMSEIVNRKSSFDDSSIQMPWKHFPKTANCFSFSKYGKVVEDCKVSSDVEATASIHLQRKHKKVRKGSLDANLLKSRKNKACFLPREEISNGSSSCESKNYLNRNYNKESSEFYTNSNVTPDSNEFVNIAGHGSNIFKPLMVTDYLNSQVNEENKSKNCKDLKSNLSVKPSALTHGNSSITELTLLPTDKNKLKPMKSFLQQLKLKNETKQTKRIYNINRKPDIEDKESNANLKNSCTSESFEVVDQEYQNYTSGDNDISVKARKVTDNLSGLHGENEKNVKPIFEEIKSAEVINAACKENCNILTFDGISSKSHQLIESFQPSHPLFAEISIQNEVEETSLENYSSPYELTDSNNQLPDNHEDLQEEKLNEETERNYQFLLRMENLNLVRNVLNFTCPVCFGEFESDQGVVLHECLHTFCLDCLRKLVEYAEEAQIKCPFRDDTYSCQSHLQQREIKALVSEDVYERYLQRSIVTAESLAEKSFHCKTPDCPGWCMFEDSINVFHCPVCSHYNCLNCMAMHEGLNCRQYQDKLMQQKKMDPDSEKTLQFLNKMIENGKAVKCPKCDLILMKKWGCDWLKCSVCLTEICWITKGPRWGPAGQGDTSAGCRCGVNNIKCHPSCTYCH